MELTNKFHIFSITVFKCLVLGFVQPIKYHNRVLQQIIEIRDVAGIFFLEQLTLYQFRC